MTPTPRERFDESFPSLNFSSVEWLKNEDSIARSAIWSFFEPLIEEARQDERNKFLERIEKRTAEIEEQLNVTKSQFVIDKIRGWIEELKILISSL